VLNGIKEEELDKKSKIAFGKKVLDKCEAYSCISIWEKTPQGATAMDKIRKKTRDVGGFIQMGGNRVLAKSVGTKFSVVNPKNMKGNRFLVMFNGGFEDLGSLKKALNMPFVAGTIDGVDFGKAEFEFASKFSSKEAMVSSLVGTIQSPIQMLAMCIKMYYEKMEGKS